MPKFRKRPVVIDAEQFRLGQMPYPAGVVSIVVDVDQPERVLGPYTLEMSAGGEGPAGNLAFGIHTREGWHLVTHEDWIITGVAGERYPCKPEIFAATYEPVEETAF